MNVFYEEAGGFKVGAVLADNESSLQVEAPHGKRSKIKSSAVLLRFDQPALSEFMEAAQQAADEIDTDFLWECCGADEFGFDVLGKEYFGSAPTPAKAAGLLLKLHGAPMYFYKKGKGRYKAAPADALKAALASVEKKRLQAQQQERYVSELKAHRLPDEFRPVLAKLLYAPDKNSLEVKALEAASDELKLTPAQLLAACGALHSPHDYHLGRFLFEYFPHGTDPGAMPAISAPADLPRAEVRAFSIDDVTTTEIDDAFSVTALPNGNTRVGIHIAAPALGIPIGSAPEALARARLSTVYFPGRKITMLPEPAIEVFTLQSGTDRPALSLYVEVDDGGTVMNSESRVELVPIAANLRHEELALIFSHETVATGSIQHEFGGELLRLWRFGQQLQAARGQVDSEGEQRVEYNFYVENDHVRIVERERGSPIDKIVAELMICVNTQWGKLLADAGYAALYRAQSGGVARMTTVPTPHAGLGVAQYAWSSSPLRRYVDLINQRQLIALIANQTPPYAAEEPEFLAALRDFEFAYEAYGKFQRDMERYWCLRWIEQEQAESLEAMVIRENLVRFKRLPLVIRVPSLHDANAGDQVTINLSRINLWELTVHGEFAGKTAEKAVEGATRE